MDKSSPIYGGMCLPFCKVTNTLNPIFVHAWIVKLDITIYDITYNLRYARYYNILHYITLYPVNKNVRLSARCPGEKSINLSADKKPIVGLPSKSANRAFTLQCTTYCTLTTLLRHLTPPPQGISTITRQTIQHVQLEDCLVYWLTNEVYVSSLGIETELREETKHTDSLYEEFSKQ